MGCNWIVVKDGRYYAFRELSEEPLQSATDGTNMHKGFHGLDGIVETGHMEIIDDGNAPWYVLKGQALYCLRSPTSKAYHKGLIASAPALPSQPLSQADTYTRYIQENEKLQHAPNKLDGSTVDNVGKAHSSIVARRQTPVQISVMPRPLQSKSSFVSKDDSNPSRASSSGFVTPTTSVQSSKGMRLSVCDGAPV